MTNQEKIETLCEMMDWVLNEFDKLRTPIQIGDRTYDGNNPHILTLINGGIRGKLIDKDDILFPRLGENRLKLLYTYPREKLGLHLHYDDLEKLVKKVQSLHADMVIARIAEENMTRHDEGEE